MTSATRDNARKLDAKVLCVFVQRSSGRRRVTATHRHIDFLSSFVARLPRYLGRVRVLPDYI